MRRPSPARDLLLSRPGEVDRVDASENTRATGRRAAVYRETEPSNSEAEAVAEGHWYWPFDAVALRPPVLRAFSSGRGGESLYAS